MANEIAFEETDGSSSMSARVVQSGLKQLGYYSDTPDNKWGPKSARAFLQFAASTPSRASASAEPSEDKHTVFISPSPLVDTLLIGARRYADRVAQQREAPARHATMQAAPTTTTWDSLVAKVKENWKLAAGGAVLCAGLVWYMRKKR